MTNIIRLPRHCIAETWEDYRFRVAEWRKQKGWVSPQPSPVEGPKTPPRKRKRTPAPEGQLQLFGKVG